MEGFVSTRTRNLLLGGLVVAALLVGGAVVGILYLLAQGPEIFVVHGQQLPRHYLVKLRKLGLLEEGEAVRYFYSDGLIDIEEGLYFVTDDDLVLYAEDWAEPRLVIPFEDIQDLSIVYDDSFWTDSYVTVQYGDGLEVGFPLSSEQGGDERFFEFARGRVRERGGR